MQLPQWRPAFDAFLARPTWPFVVSWARESSCLPVYCDWTHVFGVTETGTVLSFQHEPWPGVGPPNGEVTDVAWLNLALHQGVKLHPWLAPLLPPRPHDARSCASCSGTGHLPIPKLVCDCGGAGWLPAE